MMSLPSVPLILSSFLVPSIVGSAFLQAFAGSGAGGGGSQASPWPLPSKSA